MYTRSHYVCPECARTLVSGMTLINDRPIREYRCWCGYRMSLSKRGTSPKIAPIASAVAQQIA
jgi:DNA-directed RNA polymerase subunit RPC12/RpoP